MDTGLPVQGPQGVTPEIGNNGNWWIGGVDTGVPATGPQGPEGHTPYVGVNGNWWINAKDTWIAATGPQGPQGPEGPEGPQGDSPYIGPNGNWWLGTTDSGIPATGPEGEPGLTPEIGPNGNWWIGTIDTGVAATGPMGPVGDSPYIGSNGNWWIGGVDTGIPATGPEGPEGPMGPAGLDPEIGFNGNWWIGGVDTGYPATGPQGPQGPAATVPEIGPNGNWWIGGIDSGIPATGPEGPEGGTGVDGKSAYELWKEAVDDGSMTNKDGTPYMGDNSWESFLIWLQGGDVSVLYNFWLAQGNSGSMEDFMNALFDCHCHDVSLFVAHPPTCAAIDHDGNLFGTYPVAIKIEAPAGSQVSIIDDGVIIDQGVIAATATEITFYINREDTRDIDFQAMVIVPGSETEPITRSGTIKQLHFTPFTISIVQSPTEQEDSVTITFQDEPYLLQVGFNYIYNSTLGVAMDGWSVDSSKKVFTKTFNRAATAQPFVVKLTEDGGVCTRTLFNISPIGI